MYYPSNYELNEAVKWYDLCRRKDVSVLVQYDNDFILHSSAKHQYYEDELHGGADVIVESVDN